MKEKRKPGRPRKEVTRVTKPKKQLHLLIDAELHSALMTAAERTKLTVTTIVSRYARWIKERLNRRTAEEKTRALFSEQDLLHEGKVYDEGHAYGGLDEGL